MCAALGPVLSQLNMSKVSTEQPKSHEYMLVSEVAELLRISESSVYRMVEKRLVRFFKIRSGLRFRRLDIEEYLESCCFETAENEYDSTKN